jgi:hypothetical protein
MGTQQQTTRKPNKAFTEITQAGLKAYDLFTTHQARLAERIEQKQIDALVIDLEALGVHVPGAKVARETSKAATMTQNQALAHGYSLVSAIRVNVGKRSVSDDVKAGWGVGARTSPKVVSQVKSAITSMLNRAKEHPEELPLLGILPRDLDGLTQALADIKAADDNQEAQRAKAPNSTRLRNQTAQRIVKATNAIAGSGVVEFAHEAERELFQALIGAGNGKGRGKAGAEAPVAAEGNGKGKAVEPGNGGEGKGK